MGSELLAKKTFLCQLCERRLKRTLLAQTRLKNSARMDQRICRQCEMFLSQGLGFLSEKVAAKRWTLVAPGDSDVPPSFLFSAPPKQDAEPAPPKEPISRASRQASTIEKEAFAYHALSVERHIEGFIKGLETAGMDRARMTSQAVAAVNNLLHIAQTLTGQRREVQSQRHLSRSDIRRMSRHVDETALLVKEYISAVGEECHRSVN